MKHIKIERVLSSVVVACLIITSTPLQAIAEEINENHQWQEIITSFEGDQNKNSLNSVSTTPQAVQNNEEKSIQNEKQFTLEAANGNFKTDRFIIKYKDNIKVKNIVDIPDLTEDAEGKKTLEEISDSIKQNDIDKKSEDNKTDSEQLAEIQESIPVEIDSAQLELSQTPIDSAAVVESDNIMILDTKKEMTGSEFKKVLETKKAGKDIEYIQPDYELAMSAVDPYLEEQWGHYQKYQPTELEGGSGSDEINTQAPYRMDANVLEAWEKTKGAGSVVALLDTGIETTHVDLQDNLMDGWDFVNDDDSVNDFEWKYDQWHGTHIAGIIVAEAENGVGIAGVAPESRILPLKVFQGGVAYTSDIIEAINYAEMCGAKIANCSWGTLYDNPALKAAIENSSMVFVCAAGNGLYDIDKYPVYPASYKLDNVISVTSIDQDGKLSRFANYGDETVDIAAPGRDICSTTIDNDFAKNSGTSMSAGYVSGALALLLSKEPTKSAEALKSRLISSGDKITGLMDKVKNGRKLNCNYAISINPLVNFNTIVVDDDEQLPDVSPNVDVEDSRDNYETYAENTISIKTPMPTARYQLGTVAVGNKIYAIGGRTASGYSNKVEEYNPKTDTWTTKTNMPTTSASFGITKFNDQIYVFGGYNGSLLNTVQVYTPANDTWMTMPATHNMPIAMAYFTATSYSGKIYIIGGVNSTYLNTIYEYNPSTGSWVQKPSLLNKRAEHVAVEYGGKIYIDGGAIPGGYDRVLVDTEEVFDIAANQVIQNGSSRTKTFSGQALNIGERCILIAGEGTIAPSYTLQYSNTIIHSSLNGSSTSFQVVNNMFYPRSGLGAAEVNGKIYAIGGSNVNGELSVVEELDLGWEVKGNLPAEMKNFTSIECNGKLYLFGGETLQNGTNGLIKTAFEYNPETNTWKQKADMPEYREKFAVASAYGKIYIIGGKKSTTSTGTTTVDNKVYVFDPVNNSWTEKASFSSPRYDINAANYNNLIYIAGGRNSSSSLVGNVEVFNPLNGTWNSKQNLSLASTGHSLTVSNNKLLLIGGTNSSVLEYNSSLDSWSTKYSNLSWSTYSYTNSIINLYGNVLNLCNIQYVNKIPYIEKYDPATNKTGSYQTFYLFNKAFGVTTLNNKVYAFDGSGNYATKMIEYRPSVNPWLIQNNNIIASRHMGIAVIGSDIYHIGGEINNPNSGGITSTNGVYKLNTTNNSWSPVASMNYSRSGFSAGTIKGKIYVAGGYTNGVAIKYTEEYDPSLNTWTIKSPIGVIAGDAASAVYNGKMYVFGGRKGTGEIINLTYIYDPVTNQWNRGANMPVALYGCRAATLVDGKIYLTGGTSTGLNKSSSLYIYDPNANTWTYKQNMPEGLLYAVAVGKDNLYVYGGLNGESVNGLVYEYNPVTNRWYSWAGPGIGLYGSGVAIVNNGIYVINGSDILGTKYSLVKYMPLGSYNADYIHLGEESINLSGNLARNYTDLSYTSQGFQINFSRTYNSRDDRTEENIINKGWTFGFQGKVSSAGNDTLVRLPNGSGYYFRENTDGTYTAKDSRSTLVKQADGSYIMTTKDLYSYGFNGSGYLTWMKDRNGNTVTIAVDSTGKITLITDPVGRQTTIAYNTSNKINTITDFAGRIVTYAYDTNGYLNAVTDPMGIVTRYSYNSNGFLSEVRDHNSNLIESFTYYDIPYYDTLPKLKTVTDALGKTETYQYDEGEGSATITDNNGRQNITWYDKMLYPTRTKDAEGKETRTEYNLIDGVNKYGEERVVIDRRGSATYYDRDNSGNVIRQINPDVSIKEFGYDDKNNLTSEKDETGKRTFYVYDSNKINLIKTVKPLNGTDVYTEGGSQTNFAITANTYYTTAEAQTMCGKAISGLLKTVTDPESNVTTYTYDAYGNIAVVKNALNKTATYQYNPIGWLKQETSVKGYITKYYYDRNGLVTKKVYNGGETERTIYDYRRRITQNIKPNQYLIANDTASTYEANNILTNTNTYGAAGAGYRYVYYTNGQLQTETDPLNYSTNYTYDQYGNVLKKTLTNGYSEAYTYDVLNREKTAAYQTSSAAAIVLTDDYSYNVTSEGYLEKVTKHYFNSSFAPEYAISKETYNYADNLIRTDNADNGYSANEYLANGNLSVTTDPIGNKVYYTYDGLNRVNGKWSSVSTGVCSYEGTEYYKNGNVKKQTASANTVAPYSIPSSIKYKSFLYDAVGRITEQGDSFGGRITFTYDDTTDKVIQRQYTTASDYIETEIFNNYFGKVKETDLKVNSSDMKNAESVLKTTYTFDKEGNILTELKPNNVTTTYTYDYLGRKSTQSEPGINENGQAAALTNTFTYDFRGNVLTEKDPLNRITEYTYNPAGLLLKVKDPKNGITYTERTPDNLVVAEITPKNYTDGTNLNLMTRTTYQYDNMGRVAKEYKIYKDLSGTFQTITKEYSYDKNGNMLTSKDGMGYVTTYTYDGQNRQKTVLDPDANDKGLSFTTKFTYDGLGQKTAEENGVHAVISYTYNDQGKVLTVAVGEVRTKTYTYDLAGNMLSEKDGNNNTTTYTYNALGKVRTQTLPGDTSIASHAVSFVYTNTGDIATATGSLLKANSYTYDNQHRLLSETERKSDGTSVITKSYRYDLVGNMRFSVDGKGKTTEYTYDALNQKLTQKISVTINGTVTPQTTTYEYNADGKLTGTTDWLGNKYENIYDSLDRLVSKKDPFGNAIEILAYDNNHRQISSTDSLTHTINFGYDKANRLISKTDASQHTESKTYDAAGNIASSTDGEQNVINYQYDASNRLKTVTNALLQVTSYTYDATGNLLTQTDGKGNVTTYQYNVRNLPTARIDAGGITSEGAIDYTKAETYQYYSDGKLSSKTDRNGVQTNNVYDIHGRLLSENVGGDIESYTYDNNGNQLTMVDATGTTTRVYDELGRVISKTVPTIGTTTFLYDQVTGLTPGFMNESYTDPKGNIIVKTKDKAGRLYQVKDGGSATTYTYYTNGNLLKLEYTNGATEEYTYYDNNKLYTLVNKQGGSILEAFSYDYDSTGNMTGKADGKGITSYTYDDLNRLLTVSGPNGKTTSYEFDAAGNRNSETITEGGNVTKTEYAYTEQNRLVSTNKLVNSEGVGGEEYSFDNNGNVLSVIPYTITASAITTSAMTVDISLLGSDQIQNITGAAVYEYDVRNQMIKAVSGANTVESKYNGDGLRVSKTVNGETSNYLYEYDKIILETDGSNAEIAQNIYGTNLINRSVGSDSLYYLYNGHGDVVSLQSAAGTTAAQYYYDAFGTPTEVTGNANNPFRYAGYEYDVETDLYYLKARMYDSVSARFMQEDTYRGELGDPLSLNYYSYCCNNPLIYTDPDGHWQKGDEKYNLTTQKKLKQMTDAYYSTSDKNLQKKIQAEAQKLRDGEKQNKNNKADNFASAAIDKINKNGYLTSTDWKTLSTAYERRSNGSMTIKSTTTINNIVNTINTNSKYSDYRIGSKGYLSEVELIKKQSGNMAAMNYIMDDTYAHEGELSKVKQQYFINGNKNFYNFYNEVNNLVTGMNAYSASYTMTSQGGRTTYSVDRDYSAFERIHYFRNELNWAPNKLSDMIKLAKSGQWSLLPVDASIYHMYGENGEYNVKFVSKDGHFEGVYNTLTGKIVTDPINMGTYNYGYPLSLDHFTYDVNPWEEYGNVPGGFAPKENTKDKFNKNPDAQDRYDNVGKKIK